MIAQPQKRLELPFPLCQILNPRLPRLPVPSIVAGSELMLATRQPRLKPRDAGRDGGQA